MSILGKVITISWPGASGGRGWGPSAVTRTACRTLPIKINKKVRGGGPKIECEKVAESPPSHKIIVKV